MQRVAEIESLPAPRNIPTPGLNWLVPNWDRIQGKAASQGRQSDNYAWMDSSVTTGSIPGL